MRLFPASLAAALSLASACTAFAQVPAEAVFAAAKVVQPKVVAWRRDIHQHPELGNREVRTAAHRRRDALRAVHTDFNQRVSQRPPPPLPQRRSGPARPRFWLE